MFDCANVEMRELLPELVAGTLDVRTRARVEAHVASCAECASELETLRAVRSAFGTAPAIDVGRIVAALPKPVAPRATSARPPIKRWLDWRIAAALTMITVGGLSLAVVNRLGRNDGAYAVPPRVVQDSPAVVSPGPEPSPTTVTPPETVPVVRNPKPNPAARAESAKAQLAFGGGVEDLDDASLRALLGALDDIDRAPVAPSAEPDRTPLLPVIKEEGQR